MSLISAHRCQVACELAELEIMPMIVRNLEDNEAISHYAGGFQTSRGSICCPVRRPLSIRWSWMRLSDNSDLPYPWYMIACTTVSKVSHHDKVYGSWRLHSALTYLKGRREGYVNRNLIMPHYVQRYQQIDQLFEPADFRSVRSTALRFTMIGMSGVEKLRRLNGWCPFILSILHIRGTKKSLFTWSKLCGWNWTVLMTAQ